MTLLTAAALLALQGGGAAPVTLSRKFEPNEKLTYRVQSTLQVQSRSRGLNTWMPEDLTMKYDFTTEVQKMKADGIAQLRYRRPTLTTLEDSGQEAGPARQVEKLNWDLQLTMSPLNRLIEMKDLTPAKKPSQKFVRLMKPPTLAVQDDVFGSFIGEVYRLALFAGGLDSSLDFAPPLPLREVAVGDTWKSTVGYQPQKLKGKDGKSAVQRLDYTYTYKGIVASNGKKVHRVVGEVDLKTDLAEFFHQLAKVDSDESGLSKWPLNLKTKIDFDLDLKTMRTLTARATSQGGFQIFVTDFPDDAVAEEKLSGGTTLSLVGVGKVAAAPAKKK